MPSKKAYEPSPEQQGWLPPEVRDYGTRKEYEKVLESCKIFSAAGSAIAGSGEGKIVLLHKYLAELNGGKFPVNHQTLGDCVSHGGAKAIENLMAVQILLHGKAEQWPGILVATEWLYGTSRVLVGRGRLGNGDGSLGSWLAKAVQEHGVLFRKKYGNFNLTTYSGHRAKKWGYRGLPYQLEEIADEHPVKTTALVTSYEQARDAIANGYPVVVCSSQGFNSRRDSEGFARASGTWHHCMYFCAVDDAHRRPGLLCVNSWGERWINGPKRHEQPEGSFWVDAEICDRMLRGQDSYSFSNMTGFPAQQLEYVF